MDLVCTKYCLDKDEKPYKIGNRYRYYDSDFIFDSLDNKVYDIYSIEDGKDVHRGIGSIQFIRQNFSIEKEMVYTRILCNVECKGPNGKLYYKDRDYFYSIKDVYYSEGDNRMYSIYDSDMEWLGYVKRKFIRKNFIEWSDYLNELVSVDELFGQMLAI